MSLQTEIADIKAAINSPATPEAQKEVMRGILKQLESKLANQGSKKPTTKKTLTKKPTPKKEPTGQKKYVVVKTWNGEGYSEDNEIIEVGTFPGMAIHGLMGSYYKKAFGEDIQGDIESNNKGITAYYEDEDDNGGSVQAIPIKDDSYGVLINCNENEVEVLTLTQTLNKLEVLINGAIENTEEWDIADFMNGKGRLFLGSDETGEDVSYQYETIKGATYSHGSFSGDKMPYSYADIEEAFGEPGEVSKEKVLAYLSKYNLLFNKALDMDLNPFDALGFAEVVSGVLFKDFKMDKAPIERKMVEKKTPFGRTASFERTTPKKEKASSDEYDCDDLIEKAKKQAAKRKKADAKRESKSEKTQNKERVERSMEVVEKSIETRIEKGDKVSVAEITELIAKHEQAIKHLKELLKKIK